MEIFRLSDDLGELGRKCDPRVAGVMKITDIRAAVRDENRVNIFIDNEYSFSLDISQVVELKIKVGREISEEELTEFRKASEFGKLYQRALEWVLIRPRSIKETQDYLRGRREKRRADNLVRARNRAKADELKRAGDREMLRKMRERKTPMAELPEIDEASTKLVMERLLDRGYLDDRKFAEYYVENRFVKKGVSRKRLEMELLKKGVSRGVIEEVLAESPRNEKEEIAKIVAKKRARYDNQKLLAYLVRQGFSYDAAKDAILAVDELPD